MGDGASDFASVLVFRRGAGGRGCAVTGGACRSGGPEGVLCGRVAGHPGMHFDRSHTHTWLVAIEGVPVTVEVPAVRGMLSRREVEVLQGLADGLTCEQIGSRLFLSPNTIRSHKHRIAKRVGGTSAAHAVAWGFRNGVLS